MPNTVKVFVSYSHQDANYLNEDSLLGFLQGLETAGVEFWTDREIGAGELWDDVIKANLQDSQIALALVSQDFLDSIYCRDVENRGLLENKVHVIPILLSPCEKRPHEHQRCPLGIRPQPEN